MKILTVEQVAELLQLPQETVYKHLREKKLIGSRLGKHWRVNEENVKKYLEDNEKK